MVYPRTIQLNINERGGSLENRLTSVILGRASAKNLKVLPIPANVTFSKN
jgi:hypothetical protein